MFRLIYLECFKHKYEDEFLIKLKMFLIIGAGGFLGAVMRYYVSGIFTKEDFPCNWSVGGIYYHVNFLV